jgi:archaemetzincin
MALRSIYIRLLQRIEGDVVKATADHLESLLGIVCEIDSNPLYIDFAYSSERKQYHSASILARLKATMPKETSALLAITDCDLYVPGYNFIFGEAEIAGKVSIISLARLRPSFWGDEDSLVTLKDRAKKEAAHEMGHLIGLRHCDNMRCVMSFSATLSEVDEKPERYCADCAHTLAEIVFYHRDR